MSYLDRLQQTIELTSPEENQFSALWRKNPRSLSKNVGVFKYPRVRGATTQDLDVGASSWPLTIVFDGADHDLEAKRFMKAVEERGLWHIIHPVKGALDLQLLTVTENIDPMDSGPFTEFTTDWIEPIKLNIVPTVAQLKSLVLSQIDEINEVTADQLVEIVETDTASKLEAFKSAVRKVVANVESTIEKITDVSAEITAQINSIKRGINEVLSVIPLDILAMAAQIQALVQLPGLVLADLNAKLDLYEDYANNLFGSSSSSTDAEGRNEAAVKEIALLASLAAVGQITATGDIRSRVQAVELMQFSSDYLNNMIDNLDLTQEQFKDLPIDIQYFSQSTSFSTVSHMTALTLSYLLRAGFDLAIEKKFTLDRDRAPIEITITEYGALGEDAINLDLFIESNGLKGNDILLLPAGREVVVYV